MEEFHFEGSSVRNHRRQRANLNGKLMNKIIYLIIIILFIGCQNENSSIKASLEKTLDKRSKIEKKLINIDNQTKECNCDTNKVFDHLEADLSLTYYNSNLNKKGEDSLNPKNSFKSL